MLQMVAPVSVCLFLLHHDIRLAVAQAPYHRLGRGARAKRLARSGSHGRCTGPQLLPVLHGLEDILGPRKNRLLYIHSQVAIQDAER